MHGHCTYNNGCIHSLDYWTAGPTFGLKFNTKTTSIDDANFSDRSLWLNPSASLREEGQGETTFSWKFWREKASLPPSLPPSLVPYSLLDISLRWRFTSSPTKKKIWDQELIRIGKDGLGTCGLSQNTSLLNCMRKCYAFDSIIDQHRSKSGLLYDIHVQGGPKGTHPW